MVKKIIDFHTHCLRAADLSKEYNWFNKDCESKLQAHARDLKEAGIERAIVHILDEKAAGMKGKIPKGLFLSLMINFRSKNALATLRKAKTAGFVAVKILTYEQEVTPKDYSAILRLAKEAQKLKMFLIVCSTFGGINPYKHDAISLVSHLITKSFKAPLVMAHAGGSRVIEAILLADVAKNIYFDTSFTTTYWKGSSVTENLAYAIKRLPDRIMYGSDYPNISFKDAKNDCLQIVKNLHIDIQEKVFYNNALNLLKQYE